MVFLVPFVSTCMVSTSMPPVTNRSQSILIAQKLHQILSDVMALRISLGIPHDRLREALGVCRQTYQQYKRTDFKTLQIEQLFTILEFCKTWELTGTETVNPRVQNHFRNEIYAIADDSQDDGNNGDYGADDDE